MIMLTIAALTLVATAGGAYFTWRAFRQARVETLDPTPLREVLEIYEARHRAEVERAIADADADARTVKRQINVRELERAEITRVFVVRDLAKDAAPEMPRWFLSLFPAEDAERYEAEWNAHLYILIQDGKPREARRVRRRLAVRGIFLAFEVRARRAAKRRGAR
jgi:hypothetical protein